jgi:energy-coupling factor transporter ATP-binding protein EcfA2
MEVMFANQKENIFGTNNFIGLYGESSDLGVLFTSIKEIKLKDNAKVKSIINKNNIYLKDLNIKEDILKKRISALSYAEYKLILLLKVVSLKPDVIILNNFDLGFNDKDKSHISKFIKTINATYHTIFIVITNDLIFMNKNCKHIIIMKNKIIKYQGDIITAIKQDLIEKPVIIKFIDMANEKNAKLDYTLDNKELLKGIYRSVF